MIRMLPQSLWAALAFLTRLPSPVLIDEASLAASLRWYPLAGLVIGAFCTLPLTLGLFAGHPTVQGWLYVGLSVWVTRGLHWDGLADVLDAWGSATTGARFRQILKDSRLGAFGAMGLTFGLLGFTILSTALCEDGILWPLLLAPALGRSIVCLVLFAAPVSQDSTLGKLLSPGRSLGLCSVHLSLAALVLSLLLGPTRFVTLVALLTLGLTPLLCLARREGGINGDFLGSSILVAEICLLLTSLA